MAGFRWSSIGELGTLNVMNYPVIIRRVVIFGIIVAGIFGLLWWWGPRIPVNMKQKSAMKSAYQIHQALFAYSTGHDGNFPTAEHTSNEAFRELFKEGLVDDERLFFVKGSAWHGKATAPDGKIGNAADGFAEALGPGENHWAYTSGLSADRSDATLPLIMDGFTDVIGTWCDDPKARGGIRSGRFQVTVGVGGNARVNDGAKEGQSILDRIKPVPGAKLLNPDPPK